MERSLTKAFSILTAICLILTCIAVFELPQVDAAQSTTITAAPGWDVVANPDLRVGTFVAAYNATFYGVATGNTAAQNVTALQNIINRVYNLGGGAVYIPAGRYPFNNTVTLRKGVTIRGDWVEPIKGKPIDPAKNTIIEVAQHTAGAPANDNSIFLNPASNVNNKGFIEMEPESCVANLTFFYPTQTFTNVTTPVRFRPTIVMGCPNYFGNEYCNVRDITLVNS
ncbi:MAG: glycoside hydrolase family 55 protein [Oscillospiraceae bacterium]|nr:glycoside hydrolase family 55 protein [Oscillospiraceae bacterium]